MAEPIPVPVGDCRCPGAPHEEDTVFLAPELGLAAGLAVEAAMAETSGAAQTVAVSLALINNNIVDWTFIGSDGQPVPINPVTIQTQLPYARGGEAVANKAAGLYLDSFITPLAERVRTHSPRSLTNGQTRPILTSRQPSRRKRGGSSSRAGSAGTP